MTAHWTRPRSMESALLHVPDVLLELPDALVVSTDPFTEGVRSTYTAMSVPESALSKQVFSRSCWALFCSHDVHPSTRMLMVSSECHPY